MRKALIVTEGQWGIAVKEDYQRIADSMKESIERREIERNGRKEKLAVVDVISTLVEAEKMIRDAPVNDRVDVLFFLSRGAISQARAIKKKYPLLLVVVLTGLVPEDEIVIVNKTWAMAEFLEDLIRSPR